MRYLILGSGAQGRACAYDLLRHGDAAAVQLADADAASLAAARAWLADPRVETTTANAADAGAIARLARGHDVLVSCVPYFLNLPLARAAIAAGCHFVDLGGSTRIVLEELALDGEARAAGVTLIPDCGLGPGMISTIAVHAMEGYERVDDCIILDGGLPEEDFPPLGYMLVFSVHGLINEYTGKATALREGRRVEVDALSEIETVDLPPPLGRCEVGHAAGGLSTMAWTYEGRVRNMHNKLIRRPGHLAFMTAMRDLGFFDTEGVDLDGARVAPRALAAKLFERSFSHPGAADLVFIQVTVRGLRAGAPSETVCEMLDRRDDASGLTAMTRTTGFPAAIIAHMLASGRIARRGAFPVEIGVPSGPFLDEAAKRGFAFRWKTTPR